MLVEPFGMQLLEYRNDARVQRATVLQQERRVRHFVGQRMLESIRRRRTRGVFDEEFRRLQTPECGMQRLFAQVANRP